MGIDFSIGRPQPTLETEFRILEEMLEGLPDGLETLSRIKKRVEEEMGLSYEDFEYVDVGRDLRAHWAYSGFGRFRERVAAVEGISLKMMWGYGPSNDLDAYTRLHPERDWKTVTPKDYDGAMELFYEEHVRQWDDHPTPLRPFLDHSDADGEMTSKECAQVAPRLAECVEEIANRPDPKLGHRQDNDVINGRKLVEMMRYCADNDLYLLFR